MSTIRDLVILAVLAVAGYAGFQAYRADQLPILQEPAFRLASTSTSGGCTVLGDYCIRLRCEVENTGTGRGTIQVSGILSRSEADDLTHGDTATLAPGERRPVFLDFRDATVRDPEDALRCDLTPVPRDWRRLLPF